MGLEIGTATLLAGLFGGGATAIGGAIGASKQAGASTKNAQLQSDAATKAAQIQSDSSTKAAEIRAKSDADALQFLKDQAALDAQRANATQQANYNQWAAGQGYRSSLGEMLGLPARQIPNYVPLPTGQTPTGMTPTTGGTPGTTLSGAPGASAATMPSGIDPRFAPLSQKYGITPIR